MDIRSFFGGGSSKKATPAPTPTSAAPSSAKKVESKKSPSQPSTNAATSEKKSKSKGKKETNKEEEDGNSMDQPQSKKKKSTSAKSDSKDSSSSSTPSLVMETGPKKQSSTDISRDEVKSPHFDNEKTKPSTKMPTTGSEKAKAAPAAASSKPHKKRIRDEYDDDDDDDAIEIVGPKKLTAAPVSSSPVKQVVIRRESSPKKSTKPTGPVSASDFFAQANADESNTKPKDTKEQLKAKVEAKQKEMERQRLMKEAEELQRDLKAIQEADEREAAMAAMDGEGHHDTIVIDPPTETTSASVPASDAASVAMEDVPFSKVETVKIDDDDEIQEIAKPLRKSPTKATAKSPAKSPSSKKAKLEPPTSPLPTPSSPNRQPPKSPIQSNPAFAPFTPSTEPRPSLSTNATIRAPSPQKLPTSPPPSSSPRPTSALTKSPSPLPKSPTASKPSAASTRTPSAKRALAVDDVDDFGGVNLSTSSFADSIADASPAKKLKTETGSVATAPPPSGEKKKWRPGQAPAVPQHLGSKVIPIAKPRCFAGLTFVLTGTGDSITREDLADLIKKYEGKVTSAVSGKTDYLVAGSEPGESKIAKAKTLKTKIINEDEFLQLMVDLSKGWTPPSTTAASSAASTTSRPMSSVSSTSSSPSASFNPSTFTRPTSSIAPPGSAAELAIMRSGVQTASSIEDMLWVDAHRPLRVDQIIGNPGLVKQISEFLSNWHKKRKDREMNLSEKDQEKAIKAMLISGPPGIGKSTAVGVIARSLGFEVIEFNASDTRNKKELEHVVGDITGNRGLTEFFSASSKSSTGVSSLPSKPTKPKPNVIVMDEVDGMSSGDIGGMGELVSLIKKTRTPIICIANDASSPKMKTLKNYCECITWKRVPAAQIAPKIQEICRREGLEIDRPSLEKLAESTQGDIRQILNFLQFARQASKSLSFDEVKARIDKSGKDFDLGPFDVVPNFFKSIPPAPAGRANDWLGDRQNLYFVDSDLIPLFVQENYLHARPFIAGLSELKSNTTLVNRTRAMPNGQTVLNDVLALGQIAEAADSISMADLLSDAMYTEQDYSLMPSHAVLSTIYPGYIMRGGLHDRINFPGALGKQSTRNKNLRISREFRTALSIDIHVDSSDIAMFVLPALKQEWMKALAEKDESGIDYVISQLDHFGLDKEEFDLLMEWGEKFVPEGLRFAAAVPGTIKAKLTRVWKSGSHLRKVSHGMKGDAGDISRGRSSAFKDTLDDEGEEDDMDGEETGDGEQDNLKPVESGPSKKASSAKSKPKPSNAKKASGSPKKPRPPRKSKATSGSKKKPKGNQEDDEEEEEEDF